MEATARINTALHMIAVTKARGFGPGSDYIAKRIAQGHDKTEALRLLRRRIPNAVFAAMLTDERATTTPFGDHFDTPIQAAA